MNFLKTLKYMIFFSALNVSAQQSFYDLTINSIDGELINFNTFKGKKILIVNVASNCGFTSQYKALEDLSQQYKDSLVILGVPCNQFGGQEPKNEVEIIEFCKSNYGVTFLMSEKVHVKGNNQHPLYSWLTNKKKNGSSSSSVKWNFQKYLIDNNGKLINYFYSTTSPTSRKITSIIEQ
ncbi:MAG: glutathione peroxidase [Flavobacteriales bacterium]|jgi:glutathione peroxidase|nr:glutathione peroxidase [Flavobacteriales bacterium]|tara:strand:- start:1949 stop:2485 length:537 start_codon:yes stop_codon:yes gene_type:complete